MRGHEYKVGDRIVNKMSRDGLTEENLQSREAVRISRREPDSLSLPGQAADSFSLRKKKTGFGGQEEGSIPDAENPAGGKRRQGRPAKQQCLNERLEKPAVPEPAGERFNAHPGQEPEGGGDGGLDRRLQEEPLRRGTLRRHPSGGKAFAEPLAGTGRSQKKNPGFRLSSGNDEGGMVHGQGMGIRRKAVSVAAHAMSAGAREQVHEAVQENAAAEGAYRAERMAEHALRRAMRTSRRMTQQKLSRWREHRTGERREPRLQAGFPQEAAEISGQQDAGQGQAGKNALNRFWQKQRIKKSYQAAKKGGQATAEAAKAVQGVSGRIKSAAFAAIKNNRWLHGAAAIAGLLFLMLFAGLSGCSSIFGGASSGIAGTTYPGTDEAIHETENAYAALEEALNLQINGMESTHPGYDEYRYQIDGISHNPYHLVSYFTVKYGAFTYSQVAGELEEIFREQYSLYVDEASDTVTETKTVRVGESLGLVVTSGYCGCSACCGVWAGGTLPGGTYPAAGHTIAVDASDPFVPLGTKVVMNGVEYVVEDTGAFARYGVQFDIYYDSHSAALAHGHQTWEAYLSDSTGGRDVEVSTTKTVRRLEVRLANHNLDTVLRNRMDENEKQQYALYNASCGNRNYLFDAGSLPGGADVPGYEIPPEALTDAKFAKMIREAEKYLGFPYVWGGASPETSFDCSGFVSWVINNCGNGWDVGRQTAEGLRGRCAPVPPEQARPGDLVFFQNTYPTPGASHVGIYVGDSMMIHCGEPIQYTNISSRYWQEHLLGFGRLP